jgi:hypothetical protein
LFTKVYATKAWLSGSLQQNAKSLSALTVCKIVFAEVLPKESTTGWFEKQINRLQSSATTFKSNFHIPELQF